MRQFYACCNYTAFLMRMIDNNGTGTAISLFVDVLCNFFRFVNRIIYDRLLFGMHCY